MRAAIVTTLDSLAAITQFTRLNGMKLPGGGGVPDSYDVSFRAVVEPRDSVTVSAREPEQDGDGGTLTFNEIERGFREDADWNRQPSWLIRRTPGMSFAIEGVLRFARTERGWELLTATMLLADSLTSIPHGSTALRMNFATLKADLRNLVTAQESYFSRSQTYASSFRSLSGSFSPSAGVAIVIVRASTHGYEATATLERTGQSCSIAVGPFATRGFDGEPRCD